MRAVDWILPAEAIALFGVDRSLGHRLRLPTDFRDTHLARIGRG